MAPGDDDETPDLSSWTPTGADAAPSGLEIGGVYRDEGAADAPAVDFVVGRIEAEPTVEGEEVLWIAHVQIGPAGGADGVVMSHAPIGLPELLAATAGRAGSAEVGPEFEEGYDAWRDAYDDGEAGVFTIAPSQIYALTLQAIGAQPRANGRDGDEGGDGDD